MATVGELALESSIRYWTLTGPNAVVKVLSLAFATGPDAPAEATGYVTQAKFLNGRNCLQIERDLGLQPQSLREGAMVCYLASLPRSKDVEYKLSAALPGGRVWTPKMHEAFDRARKNYRGMRGETVEDYPPGATDVLQWRLKTGVAFSGVRAFVSPVISFSP